jgi:NADH-quinone oxidoreductase E subunit
MQKTISPKLHKFTLSEPTQNLIRQERSKYPHPKTAILPSLHLVYREVGYLSPEILKDVALLLDFPYAEVSEVASFYTMFPKKNVGKYFIQVCTNISCYLCGANGLLEYLEQKLGIKVGEVTPDGLFSLGTVECLGSCGTAPVIQINNQDFNENLTREKTDRIIEELKKQK